MAKAVQLNSQDRVRFRGHRGGLIPMHRALAHYGLDRVKIITAVVLVILLSSVWLLLLPQVCHFWTQVLDTGIRVLPLRAELRLHEYHLISNVNLVVPYPGMEAVLPDTRIWAITGVVTILLFAVTYFLPSHLIPFIYLLRGVLLIQVTALVYFGLIPAEFPHTPSGYLRGLLAAGLALISTVPLLFGLTLYIFDFSLIQKVSLTAMTIAHLVVFLPLQLLLQALVLQKTVLFMPVLYIIFGLPLDVLIIIGFYSWGMTWYFKSEEP